MSDTKLRAKGAPDCPDCTGKVRPQGHGGPHSISDEQRKKRVQSNREQFQKRVDKLVAEGKLLSCRHTSDNFIGVPRRAGKCKECGKVVKVRVPGVVTSFTRADEIEAGAIDLKDESTWPVVDETPDDDPAPEPAPKTSTPRTRRSVGVNPCGCWVINDGPSTIVMPCEDHLDAVLSAAGDE